MSDFERIRYTTGMLLTADEFAIEQAYHVERRRLLNRMLHGAGVISGLDVTGGDDDGTVTVAPGFALDGWGREILICEPQHVAIPKDDAAISVYAVYAEVETERSTIRETYTLDASPTPPDDAVVLGIVTADGTIAKPRP
jgi:beta-glucanase (GH16 family)